jgi:hypothetical protein
MSSQPRVLDEQNHDAGHGRKGRQSSPTDLLWLAVSVPETSGEYLLLVD